MIRDWLGEEGRRVVMVALGEVKSGGKGAGCEKNGIASEEVGGGRPARAWAVRQEAVWRKVTVIVFNRLL